jgi:hypothetical protein
MPALPSTVPWCATDNSYSEEPERNVVSFQPAVGRPKQRRRSSIADDLISFTRLMTRDQWEELKTFYRDELFDGVLPFTAGHPADAGVATFIFTAAPKAQQFSGSKRMVQISARKYNTQYYDFLASPDILAEPDVFTILSA